MRTDPAEREAHLALWQESGLSRAAYCRAVGIPYHRLLQWTRGANADDDVGKAVAGEAVVVVPADAGFVELRRAVDDGLPAGAILELGSGRRLRIAGTVDPAWAARLLGVVLGC